MNVRGIVQAVQRDEQAEARQLRDSLGRARDERGELVCRDLGHRVTVAPGHRDELSVSSDEFPALAASHVQNGNRARGGADGERGGELGELRQSHAGAVLAPGDSGYDAARRCFNALVDRRPAVIMRCLGASDIATAFDFARTHELELAVRGGGHNPAGHCVVDAGLVIDLSELRSVEVDPDTRIARADGGSTWLDFDSATQAYGLVAPGGIVGSTGVCGLTLGGGIGHLTAQYGLTCDNLVGAELVTPDGSVVRVSSDENTELLWALRGGGGNFGVATRLEFRLHDLDRVVGGRLDWRGDGVRDALRRFRDVVAGFPRELSCQAVLSVDETSAPALVVAPCSTRANGTPELDALRSALGAVGDTVRDRSFLDQQLEFDSPYGENRHYWKGHFVRELADELIDELVDRVVAFGRPPCHVLLESLHGAPKERAGHVGARVSRCCIQRERDGRLGRCGSGRESHRVGP